MNEKEFGESLLRWDAAGRKPDDPSVLTEKFLRRDRWRVRLLTACVVGMWLVAIAGIGLHFFFVSQFIGPKIVHRVQEAAGTEENLPQRVHDTYILLQAIAKESVVLVSGTVLAVVLAGVSSVFLIFASRKSTLRQVNANLMAISEQLSRLREAPGTKSTG